MRPLELKIATQLRFGLGLVLALVVALGALAWMQTDTLWRQTKGLYDHPYVVRQALGRVDVDIGRISRNTRDLFVAGSERTKGDALQTIEAAVADASRQMLILRDRYLGPKADIVALESAFDRWESLRDETVRLIDSGRGQEALARVRVGGIQYTQERLLMNRLRTVESFAMSQAELFYRSASMERQSLGRNLGISVAVILVVTLLVAGQLLRAVMTPLRQLIEAATQFQQGSMHARCGHVSAEEFRTLAQSFDVLAATVQAEMAFRDGSAELHAAMLTQLDTGAVGAGVLDTLARLTRSEVAALYFHNPQKGEYQHEQSLGLGSAGRAPFSADSHEGELGAALATRRIQHITEIPEESRFEFAAVSGKFMPREVITVPLLSQAEVPGLISLASVRSYEPSAIRLISEMHTALATWASGVVAIRRNRALTEGLEHQNRELEEQKQAMGRQTRELIAMNTELEAQKRQLDQANRLKSTFLANMSHELRTPLNSVIALSAVLNRRLAATIAADERSYLEIIERNGKNLLTLINDILDLSRIEAGKEEVHSGRVSIHELAGDLVSMLASQASDKGLVLVNAVGADFPAINSDADKCRHILQNLLANAVKFTEVGSVSLSATVVEDWLDVSVIDTGIGIAAEQQAIVFDEFRQADDSTSRKHGGTGLGLAIARRYARLLGGDISVSSELGKGSAFTLRLPLSINEAAGAAAEGGALTTPQRQAEALPEMGQGKRILLVEDTDAAVIQMTDILETEGYTVEVAGNGKAALECLSLSLPDAVILDLMMPEIDGFQVLREIRSIPSIRDLPVLILTAKHVTRAELSFLKGNHIHELIQKGGVEKSGLLAAVAAMVQVREAPLGRSPSTPRIVRRPSRPGKPLVLVVEDNIDNLRTARALLEQDYELVEAQDGQGGIEQARCCLPDVILMDIDLPILDGIAALAALRRDDALRGIPVIAVTSSAMTGDRESIMAHRFDGYISKPIDHKQLTEMLGAVLGF